MAKKINLNGAKDFLFNHGEKVALGTCIFLALAFGLSGLMDAMSAGRSESGKSWTEELDEKHKEIERGMSVAQVPNLPKETIVLLDPKNYDWYPVSSDYQPQPYIHVGEREDSKRQNPNALPIRNGPKNIQLDYVPSLAIVHELTVGEPKVKTLEPTGGGGVPTGPAGFPQPKKGRPEGPGVGGGAGGPAKFLQAGDPRRMVVGHAVFPMKDQVAIFQRALKLSQKEMFDAPRDDLPFPVGFNLAKTEILPNGQPAKKDPEILLLWDPVNKKLNVSEKLKKFLSLAVYDEKSPAALEPYIWEGLTMPLPHLAYGTYPRVALNGIEGNYEEPEEGGNMPKKMPGGERPKIGLPGFGQKTPPGMKQPGMEKDGMKNDGPEYTIKSMPRKILKQENPVLDARLFDSDFNIYHALGLKRNADEAPQPNKQPFGPRGGMGAAAQGEQYFSAWDIKTGEPDPEGKQPGVGPMKKPPIGPKVGVGPGGADPKEAPFPNWDRDAVVRFIDIGVEPGKRYQYQIQIRLKNPNFGKKELVSFANLALVEELVSEWVATDIITIPNEYYLYAVDQQLLDEGKSPPLTPGNKDTVAFQIHKWEGTYADQLSGLVYPIGDWAIAERVLVHKGGKIGQDGAGQDVQVYVPFWSDVKDRFVAPPQKNKNFKAGLKMSLAPPTMGAAGGILGDSEFPVLVDFTGGKKKLPNSNAEEESAVDALIIGPNGKLRVLNSRDAVDGQAQAAKDRQERLRHSRDRFKEMFEQKTKGPALPGGGSGN